MIILVSVMVSCTTVRDSAQPEEEELTGLTPEAVETAWGPPDAVGYMDGKLYVVTNPESPPIDFSAHRVAYEFRSRNRRVWFGNGLVDTVSVLAPQSNPNDATVADPPIELSD